MRTMLCRALAAAALGGACALPLSALIILPGQAQNAPVAVSIDNFTFNPQKLTVKAGTTVTWTNKDDEPHTVVSDRALWKSPPLDTDDHFSFTFDKPGTYKYFCSIHPRMEGEIVVK
jgi:plastocyanin